MSDYNWTHQMFAKSTEEGDYQLRTGDQFDLEQSHLDNLPAKASASKSAPRAILVALPAKKPANVAFTAKTAKH